MAVEVGWGLRRRLRRDGAAGTIGNCLRQFHAAHLPLQHKIKKAKDMALAFSTN